MRVSTNKAEFGKVREIFDFGSSFFDLIWNDRSGGKEGGFRRYSSQNTIGGNVPVLNTALRKEKCIPFLVMP